MIHNRPTTTLLTWLMNSGMHADEAKVLELTGLRDKRMIDTTISTAVEMGDIVKRRVNGSIVYAWSGAEPAQAMPAAQAIAEPPKAAPPAKDDRTIADRVADQEKPVAAAIAQITTPATPKRTRPEMLPEIDLDALPLTVEPLADMRLVRNEGSRWDPVFDSLAKEPLTPKTKAFPTKTLPPAYGKALQSAALKWNKRHAPLRVRVTAAKTVCKVQRIA